MEYECTSECVICTSDYPGQGFRPHVMTPECWCIAAKYFGHCEITEQFGEVAVCLSLIDIGTTPAKACIWDLKTRCVPPGGIIEPKRMPYAFQIGCRSGVTV
jgi:hypothetical protein